MINKMSLSPFIKIFVLILTILSIANASVDVTLNPPMPVENQLYTNVCWAACACMVLRYYNVRTSLGQTNQQDIINQGSLGQDVGMKLADLENLLLHYVSQDQTFCGFWNTPPPYTLSQAGKSITDHIDHHEPIIAQVNAGDINADHAVVIIGYNIQDSMVWYNDPGRDRNNNYLTVPQTLPFATFRSFWSTAIPMNKDPYDAVEDNVGVTSGPTSLTYQTTSATYKCLFHSASGNSSALSFNWTLSFYYSGGTKVVATGSTMVNYGLGCDCSTWSPPSSAFTLPSGYNWTRDGNGLVMGDVTVSCIDSDNFNHTSPPYFLTYAEKNPYPSNIVFANQIVSASHADVKAHNTIELLGDNINNGGIINFKAGQSITILPETKILPGAAVKVTIDPSLQ